MASCKVDELTGDIKDFATVSESLSRCSLDDITEELHSDMLNAAVKSQKPGKFRTALTFFGVRKNICILPSFFGGRSKNLNKGSSKKGITKSKTHDGLSKVCHDDCLRGRYCPAGDTEYHSQRDSSGELYTCCHNECSPPTADQKSLTLGRQRKGLRSLFNSFKHHRNHRNGGVDKTEMIAMSTPRCRREVPVVHDNANEYVTECLGSEPDVPDFEDVIHEVSLGAECSGAVTVALEESVEQDSPKSELDDQMCDVQMEEMDLMAVVSSDCKETSLGHNEPRLKVQMKSEPALKSEAPTGSSDQLNLMFGDVASLKSFDSLTGCGDIIADQEDDSISESTVSGERSRNGGKRASCYLTYQGGGEEMASPEDLDEECLQDFWGNKGLEKICSACNEDHTDMTELTSSHNMDLLNSNSAQQDTSSMADVLTPQSEHQESVPTSDEGYYDSTTPGPEEGQEKADRLQTDRLPRDSYSGDALYELFAPDESLISPHYESKSKLPGSKQCEYLSEPSDGTDSVFVPDMDRLQIGAERYEVHNFHESSKSSELAQNMVGRQEISLNRDCNLNSKQQASGGRHNKEANVFDEKGNALVPAEKRTKSINADCEQRHSSVSFGSTSDPDFETFCEPKEQHLEENKPVALPYKSISSQSLDSINDLDDGQTVCFSQALVDYTKNSQMLGNLHNSVDDMQRNTAFTPNMEALPTIVTFDVVDMHNEGEYDEQIHMELEEDLSSPYQDFEESYLQKDAFAEFDYQMLDLYEQNLISNTWAVASLPRHLGLTRVSQSTANPLSLDRKSRSLDTEGLELKMPDTCREERDTIVSCQQTEKEPGRDPSPHYKKNVHVSALDVKDCSSIMALSWQTRSEVAPRLPLTGEITEVPSFSQAHVKHKQFSSSSSSDFPDDKVQRLCSNVSDRASCGIMSQRTELYNRQCHLPLQSDSCYQLSEDIDDELFCKAAPNLQSYRQSGKSRAVAHREGMRRAGSQLNAGVPKDDLAALSETNAQECGVPRGLQQTPRADH
ncbi:APC membrane recruitment protein 1-like [Limanda limanda]|uniref:APC membrane recruitment protein 1-like n=1 Tax=Limanda limanda TaxID=27771 RepID=UPI0029C80071|nr:APC membrane recruitment protein 1-like [Limanda limanda]